MLTQSLTHYPNLSKFMGPPPIIITDAVGKIKYFNPAFERNIGYTLKEVYDIDH